MNKEQMAKINQDLMDMVNRGEGEQALAIMRRSLLAVPRAKPVTDVLVDLIDGEIPNDRELIQSRIRDNAFDAYNDGKISKSEAKRMCNISFG